MLNTKANYEWPKKMDYNNFYNKKKITKKEIY